MNGWDMLRWGSLAVGGAAGAGILARSFYRAGLRIYDDLSERWVKYRQDRLTLANIDTQNRLHDLREIRPDERGRYPLLYGINGILRDPNNLRAFTLSTVLERWPQLEQLDGMQRTLIALQGVQAGSARQVPAYAGMTDGTAAATSPWPATVALEQALRGQRPSLNHLVVGAYPATAGLQVVADSIHNLMHVLEVGASGWGKSAWLRSFLYQVANAPEACEVVAIDVNGSEFNALRGWGRLRYPVARTAGEAIAVLHQVTDEIGQRKERYEQHPLAGNLVEYNEASGVDLPPWVVVIDEGTNLLNQRGIGDALRETVQTARQYGVYVLLAGQSAKHSVLDTQIRDQFSTRLCFRTSPTSSRVVLDDSAAGDLHVKGRAWCQMVGREPQEIQGPWVSRETLLQALGNGGPRHPMPALELPAGGPSADQVAQVLELHAAGESKRGIERAVFGFEGGAAYRQVTEILEAHRDATATATTGEG
ncbi:MAG TPA: FtsK/SpoIIIE domain-containing protein [Anaerolineae bacterium]|nr:FtsK/SpoIIIE domain-containing protein [Anaerolineae bacterium]